MKTEFDITLTSKDMYRFSMYHAYAGFHGISSILIAVLIFAAAIKTRESTEPMYTVLYLLFAVVFLLYLPITLYFQAKRQLRTSKVLRESLHYCIDEEGVHTSQNGEHADLLWEQIYKMAATKHNVLVYSSRIHAYVIPKAQIQQYEVLQQLANTHLPKYRLKMKE